MRKFIPIIIAVLIATMLFGCKKPVENPTDSTTREPMTIEMPSSDETPTENNIIKDKKVLWENETVDLKFYGSDTYEETAFESLGLEEINKTVESIYTVEYCAVKEGGEFVAIMTAPAGNMDDEDSYGNALLLGALMCENEFDKVSRENIKIADRMFPTAYYKVNEGTESEGTIEFAGHTENGMLTMIVFGWFADNPDGKEILVNSFTKF